MAANNYHENIIQYYRESENGYKDSWDLDHSLSIHYGYMDSKATTFRASLLRMNEIMAEAAGIQSNDVILDAGCGVGGSSIFLASTKKCRVTGISISESQVKKAFDNAKERKLESLVDFQVMDYSNTNFPSSSFDVVWGCESICYADNKENFIREAYRLLKPGGRLVVADGFVTRFEDNDHPVNRAWLDGWQVNYLETTERFAGFMESTGFLAVKVNDITRETAASSRRLYKVYFLATFYLQWKKLIGDNRATDMQKKNIRACKYQYHSRKKGLSGYGLITGKKPL